LSRKIFILILLLGSPWLAEKNIAQTYYFRHYQVENGLSNNTVHCCLQDKHGFIWMGTKDGLDRFDGYSFKVFQHDEDDSTSIGSNFLKSIYQDKDAVIYVGTNNGLYRYNDSVENFTLIKAGGEVRDIKRDSSNNLWYVIGGQLYRYDLQTHLQHAYPGNKYFNGFICASGKVDVGRLANTGEIGYYKNFLFPFPGREGTVPGQIIIIHTNFILRLRKVTVSLKRLH